MRESDIKHENGSFWVGDVRTAYTVYKAGITHSVADSSYTHNPDGLAIAIARCDYLAKRARAGQKEPLDALSTDLHVKV